MCMQLFCGHNVYNGVQCTQWCTMYTMVYNVHNGVHCSGKSPEIIRISIDI